MVARESISSRNTRQPSSFSAALKMSPRMRSLSPAHQDKIASATVVLTAFPAIQRQLNRTFWKTIASNKTIH